MWDLVLDALWPSGGKGTVERTVDRMLENSDSGTIQVEAQAPGAFKRALNESGLLAEEVLAAGELRQDRAPSLLGLVTGLALIDLLRARRSKSLPRQFALAVTAERAVAFAMSPWAEGDGQTDHVVKIKRGELASWPRERVRLIDLRTRGVTNEGTLELEGLQRIPVTWDGDPSTDELIALLGH
jgi:hypothetical protein